MKALTRVKILIVAAGSHGDVLPFIALGAELRRRGHEPHLFAIAVFEPLARQAGLPFTALGSAEFYDGLLRHPDLNHPSRSLRVMAQAMEHTGATAWATLDAAVVPGQTLVVGSTLAFATRSLAERHGLPAVTVHLAPAVLRTLHTLPRHGGPVPGARAPRWLKRLFWRLVDDFLVAPTLGAVLNRHRRAVGLAPVHRPMGDWLNQADLVIGLFPDWYAPRQPDWPAGLVLTGFPLYDSAPGMDLPPELESFLAAGPPPVAFTSGTATARALDFFTASAEACRLSGRRGVLLTRHADQVPGPLPPDVVRVDYAPFSRLLPRCAAFVHHGGIGTISQALAAGVPQLIRPMAHDQFDNAARTVALGVGRQLPMRRYRPAAVAAALEHLTDDHAMKRRCAEVAARLVADTAITEACDRILALVPRR
ncbi:glycosyltransferase [Nitrospirillum viridazoti]|uniref:Glycosyl transferase n=1 Tax=Nitrospirillum viridazoti CBAmc TaxID=1441467 RepID=A0A248JX32_9PROT|nr:nucleotide disphospho-sugar-binding domain-containing protein [Nitrospirillum amazonense]ASG23273.1 glycosyl transferase [Nitrospirillum amazonense CBAmc]TWB40066.1 UDP:flavonoid glycosyltransferase YjiC (YdhE family) [Nitrospirillum amazonense]